MSLRDHYDAGEEEVVDDDELPSSENDDGFYGDIEALKKACLLVGTDLKRSPNKS